MFWVSCGFYNYRIVFRVLRFDVRGGVFVFSVKFVGVFEVFLLWYIDRIYSMCVFYVV